MSVTSFPPTPLLSTTVPTAPITVPSTILTSITSIPSGVPPGQLNVSSSTFPPIPSTTVPSAAPTFGPPSSSTIPGLLVTSTVAKGIFGLGVNIDPLIIFALVVAGIVFLFLLGALIYCCCYYCGATIRPQQTIIKRRPSLHSIRQDRVHNRPIYLTARLTPESSYPVAVRSIGRKRYLYPADVIGAGNDVTYNTIRPTFIGGAAPVLTTLGDGYAVGHGLRSIGRRYGSGNVLHYDDDPSPQIITLY